jgi:hypothetical protein
MSASPGFPWRKPLRAPCVHSFLRAVPKVGYSTALPLLRLVKFGIAPNVRRAAMAQHMRCARAQGSMHFRVLTVSDGGREVLNRNWRGKDGTVLNAANCLKCPGESVPGVCPRNNKARGAAASASSKCVCTIAAKGRCRPLFMDVSGISSRTLRRPRRFQYSLSAVPRIGF